MKAFYISKCSALYLLIVLVLISFSHGYSAILAAKLMIKLKLDLSKNYILNAAVFKYYLHKVRETILH